MIDPKLNEIPATASGVEANTKKTEADAANLKKVSAGLSVNDTVAAGPSLSVGGQGVDTSGISAGAGAGAGMTHPNANSGVMPTVVSGARGTGTTPLSGDTSSSSYASAPDLDFTPEEISQRAYQAWCDRGCPMGSPEVDWEIAIQDLRARRGRAAGA